MADSVAYVRDSFETPASGLYAGALVDWGELAGIDELVGAGDYGCVAAVESWDEWPDFVFVRFENKPPVIVRNATTARVYRP